MDKEDLSASGPLQWSKEKPKVAGWYWVNGLILDLEIVRVFGNGELCVTETESADICPISDFTDHCQWWGPIPEPGQPPSPQEGGQGG